MDKPVLPLAADEIAYLKSIEAFMRKRVVIEQQTISGLQALLEGAPVLPECKLSWHRAFEKLLNGTREEMKTRMEELGTLEDRVGAVRASISKAELYLRDLNLELKPLKSAEIVKSVESAQAATATLYNTWQDIKVAEVTPQSRLSNFLSSADTQREKLVSEEPKKQARERVALKMYFNQEVVYRRTICKRRQSREQFLNSIPHRVQEYGTEYWTVVSDLGLLMESVANYLCNISSTCNSVGSALWALTKNMKPLVDANCHTEAIELANERSPIQFSPILYKYSGPNSGRPASQTMLFGCRPELRTDGQQTKIPPVLEYLLQGDVTPFSPDSDDLRLTLWKTRDYWAIVNEIEQAWTGIEELDRASVSKWARRTRIRLTEIYLHTLPEPVVPFAELRGISIPSSGPVPRELVRSIWNSWSQDPIKATILQAVFTHLEYNDDWGSVLCQREDPYWLVGRFVKHPPALYILCELSRRREIWSSPISDVQEEGANSSSYAPAPEGHAAVGPGGA